MFEFFPKDKQLITILIFAFLLRIIYSFFLVPKNSENLYPDSGRYNKIALNIVENKEFSIEKGKPTALDPLYPAFLAGIYSVFGQSHNAIKFFQALISTLTIFFIYGVASKIFSKKVGIVSCLISCIYPFFIYYTLLY